MSVEVSPLEHSYRRALKAYPRQWRARYGEEFIGVLLDVAESQHRIRPTKSELLGVVFHGFTARVVQILARIAPARRRDRVAAAATITITSLAAIMMVLGELGRWFRWNSYTLADGLYGPFTTAASSIYLLTFASFGATVLGRDGLRKLLLALVLPVCLAMPLLSQVAGATVPVPWYVPAVFAGSSLLSLVGCPTRTRQLTRTVLWATPVTALFLTLTSYLQGGGSQRTFYGSLLPVVDVLSLSRSAAEILLLTTAILIAGRKQLPLAVLISIAALPLPLSDLFAGFMQPGTLSILCFSAAPVGAWVAWKRPRLEFGGPNKASTA